MVRPDHDQLHCKAIRDRGQDPGLSQWGETKAPFGILVPKRSGTTKLWSVPTVNDQIILQTCVSSIAETLDIKCLDEKRAFSYRYNRDPNRLALVEDQI